jgi:hypothetical protein
MPMPANHARPQLWIEPRLVFYFLYNGGQERMNAASLAEDP